MQKNISSINTCSFNKIHYKYFWLRILEKIITFNIGVISLNFSSHSNLGVSITDSGKVCYKMPRFYFHFFFSVFQKNTLLLSFETIERSLKRWAYNCFPGLEKLNIPSFTMWAITVLENMFKPKMFPGLGPLLDKCRHKVIKILIFFHTQTW